LNKRNINEFYDPKPSNLSLDEKVRLILEVGEEVEVESEVELLVSRNP